MIPATPTFLVIDDNADSRFLLVKTLMRKFPTAIMQECQSADSAVLLAGRKDLRAIVTHRATELGGIALLRQLRTANPTVPIVMVSSIDRRDAALAAGANGFLLYDEWLRIGTVVEGLISRPTPTTTESMPPFSVPASEAEPATE